MSDNGPLEFKPTDNGDKKLHIETVFDPTKTVKGFNESRIAAHTGELKVVEDKPILPEVAEVMAKKKATAEAERGRNEWSTQKVIANGHYDAAMRFCIEAERNGENKDAREGAYDEIMKAIRRLDGIRERTILSGLELQEAEGMQERFYLLEGRIASLFKKKPA